MLNRLKFKIFGERGSGTNLIRHLVADKRFLKDEINIFENNYLENFAYKIGTINPYLFDKYYDLFAEDKIKNVGGWKHAIPDIDILNYVGATPVFVTKHPTFWISSFQKKPFHHYRSDDIYMPRRIENMERRLLKFDQLIVEKMKSYHATAKMLGGVVIQYETLLYHAAEVQECLRAIFGHCLDIPEMDVRPFISSPKIIDYKSIYGSSLLRGSASTWMRYPQFNETLEFFGYEAGAWHKTLPFTL